uniref:Uncharacterized protein n=1 Tax=Panagrolaimus sp. ES5 TaxID=591445 RepID=A0AC34FUG0_9BILA
MKIIFIFALIFIIAASTVNANRAKRSVTTFNSFGSSATNNGHVVTHANNHLTTANRGHVGTVGNVHSSAVNPHSASHNTISNVHNAGPAGAHNSHAAVHTHHVYH